MNGVPAVAQFDVYDNPSVPQREAFPYVVVLQNDQFDQFTTRFVMPLSRLKTPPRGLPRRLSQAVEIRGEKVWLAPHLCATLPARVLRRPVAALRGARSQFVDALDAVVSGV